MEFCFDSKCTHSGNGEWNTDSKKVDWQRIMLCSITAVSLHRSNCSFHKLKAVCDVLRYEWRFWCWTVGRHAAWCTDCQKSKPSTKFVHKPLCVFTFSEALLQMAFCFLFQTTNEICSKIRRSAVFDVFELLAQLESLTALCIEKVCRPVTNCLLLFLENRFRPCDWSDVMKSVWCRRYCGTDLVPLLCCIACQGPFTLQKCTVNELHGL